MAEVKKINGSISLLRNNLNEIYFEVEDANGRFLKVKITHENFALLITGLSSVGCALECHNLENVGKRKITEKRSVVLPVGLFHRDKQESWILENCQEAGWTVSPSLRSQRSFTRNEDGDDVAHYSVYKYVNPEQAE